MYFFNKSIFRKALFVSSIVWLLYSFAQTKIYKSTRHMDDFIFSIIALVVIWGIVWMYDSVQNRKVESIPKENIDYKWIYGLSFFCVASIIIHWLIPNSYPYPPGSKSYVGYIAGQQAVVLIFEIILYSNFFGKGKGVAINSFAILAMYSALMLGALFDVDNGKSIQSSNKAVSQLFADEKTGQVKKWNGTNWDDVRAIREADNTEQVLYHNGTNYEWKSVSEHNKTVSELK